MNTLNGLSNFFNINESFNGDYKKEEKRHGI